MRIFKYSSKILQKLDYENHCKSLKSDPSAPPYANKNLEKIYGTSHMSHNTNGVVSSCKLKTDRV